MDARGFARQPRGRGDLASAWLGLVTVKVGVGSSSWMVPVAVALLRVTLPTAVTPESVKVNDSSGSSSVSLLMTTFAV